MKTMIGISLYLLLSTSASAEEALGTFTDLFRDPVSRAIENNDHYSYDRRLRDDAVLNRVQGQSFNPTPNIKLQPRSEAITTVQNKIRRIEERLDYVNKQSARLQKLNSEFQALGKSVQSNLAVHPNDGVAPNVLRWNEIRGQMSETQAMLEKEGKRALDEANAIRSFASRNFLKIEDVLGAKDSAFSRSSFSVTDRIFENKINLETLQRAHVEGSASEFKIKTAADQTLARPVEGIVKVEGVNGSKIQWEANRYVEMTTTFGENVTGRVVGIQNSGTPNEIFVIRPYSLSGGAKNVEIASDLIANVNVRPSSYAAPDNVVSITRLRPSNSMLSEAIRLNKLALADPLQQASGTFSEGVAGSSMTSSSRSAQSAR